MASTHRPVNLYTSLWNWFYESGFESARLEPRGKMQPNQQGL
jgi:hypothetical protein